MLFSLKARKLRTGDCVTVFQAAKGFGTEDRDQPFSRFTEDSQRQGRKLQHEGRRLDRVVNFLIDN